MQGKDPKEIRERTCIKEAILEMLARHNTMSLATSRDNCPFASSLFYANNGFTIYFLSSPRSQHSINIYRNPQVAITINKDYTEWREIKGLQIRGKAYTVPKEEIPIAVRVYSEKYPFFKLLPLESNLALRLAGVEFFKVVPEVVRLINNEMGFGYKVELRIE
ncbi:MAG: pyridoxamine 5'-phosphate oxidase [Deltaproteobacteria bacterium]|jgi:uncharacterized protein YhbP (UPF0306 family)|nr:MAG: pyridoxamine 5'-phosphate oxidase [Deltaproteobacteria bacterium]